MAADPAAIAAAAARALEAHQLRLEKHFGFRIDRLKADDEHGDYALGGGQQYFTTFVRCLAP